MVAILDENTTSPIILNDFYESYVDDYQRGEIKYPFTNLEEGVRTLRVRYGMCLIIHQKRILSF